MAIELALESFDGAWEHVGDFPSREAAILAARTWASLDYFEGSSDATQATFGLSDDPQSGHYETMIEVYRDGSFHILD